MVKVTRTYVDMFNIVNLDLIKLVVSSTVIQLFFFFFETIAANFNRETIQTFRAVQSQFSRATIQLGFLSSQNLAGRSENPVGSWPSGPAFVHPWIYFASEKSWGHIYSVLSRQSTQVLHFSFHALLSANVLDCSVLFRSLPDRMLLLPWED